MERRRCRVFSLKPTAGGTTMDRDWSEEPRYLSYRPPGSAQADQTAEDDGQRGVHPDSGATHASVSCASRRPAECALAPARLLWRGAGISSGARHARERRIKQVQSRKIISRLATALLLAAMAACAGPSRTNIDGYVADTHRLDPEQRVAELERELAEVVPDPVRSWAFSGRLFSWSPASASPQFTHATTHWTDMREASSFRRGGVIEATVQFDMRPGVPVYRVILEPIDFPASAMDRWQGYLMLDTGLNRNEASDEQLFAPLNGATRTDDGQLVTLWVFCGHCVADGPPEGDAAQFIRLKDYARTYGARKASSGWPEP